MNFFKLFKKSKEEESSNIGTIIDSISDFLIITDLNGNVKRCNRISVYILEYLEEEVPELHILDLFDDYFGVV